MSPAKGTEKVFVKSGNYYIHKEELLCLILNPPIGDHRSGEDKWVIFVQSQSS